MSKLAIIDGDALIYMSSRETLQESLLVIDEKINNMLEKTGATHYVMFVSNTPYFRHEISSDYKLSRTKYTSSLLWLKTLKKYLVEGWNAQSMRRVEADDLCSYWMANPIVITSDGEFMHNKVEVPGKMSYVEKVLCAVDKDLLQSIQGKHFNFTYKLEDKTNPDSVIKGWWVETSDSEVYINFWKSMVCGDATDGIKGIEGSGESAFKKMLSACDDGVFPVEGLVFSAYKTKYGEAQGIFEFQKNYRLLRMLESDNDFVREIGSTPAFPNITEIPKKHVLIINEF